MSEKLESGKVKNETKTTRTHTMKDGTKHPEVKILNKDTGEVEEHTIDGEDVEIKKKPEVPRPTGFTVNQGNIGLATIKLLESINNQLAQLNKQSLEINYYCSFLEPEDKRSKVPVKPVFEEKNGGSD